MRRQSSTPVYSSDLFLACLADAKRKGIVAVGETLNERWVRLLNPDLSSVPRMDAQDEFAPLLLALREQKAQGRDRADWSDTASRVNIRDPSAYMKGMFVYYVESAVNAGVVVSGGTGMGKWIQLVEASAV